jgi:TadE-like protein
MVGQWSIGRSPRQGRRRRDGGYVTAEAAVVLPVVVMFALGMLWVITLGVAQVQSVDAARDAVRSLARGDDPAVARAYGRRSAPAGSILRFSETTASVRVTVLSQVHAPRWLLLPLPTVTLRATATAPAEGPVESEAASDGR